MLTIIIAVLVPVIGIALCALATNYWLDFLFGIGGVLTIIGGALLIVVIFASIDRTASWERIEYEYTFTKELIESYEATDDYGNVASLTDEVLKINHTIAKHKAYCHNPWFNVWYSEEIGNFEPLTLPKRNKEKNNGR